jgi:hypothetical protein
VKSSIPGVKVGPKHFCLGAADIQPNYHEPINFVLRCLESPNPPNQVLPPHSPSRLFKVSRLLRPLWLLLRMIKLKQRMIGGLLVVCLRMSRRREVVYLVKSSVLVPYMYGHTSRPNVSYTVYRVAEDHDVKSIRVLLPSFNCCLVTLPLCYGHDR